MSEFVGPWCDEHQRRYYTGPNPCAGLHMLCDYRHDHQPEIGDDLADWVYIGESGDYYVCDAHFQQRTEEGKRGWQRIDGGAL